MKRIALIAASFALGCGLAIGAQAVFAPAHAQPFGYYTDGNQSIYGGPFVPQYQPPPGPQGTIYQQFAPPIPAYQPPQRLGTCTFAGNQMFCN